MKFVTVRQPYAALLLSGIKTIERRHAPTSHRGALVIHAGKLDLDLPSDLLHLLAHVPLDLLGVRGACCGVVDVIDCRPAEPADRTGMCAEVLPGSWAWIVANPRLITPPVAMRGQQGIQRLPAGIEAELGRRHPACGT